jgi:hypothetical protein
MRKRSLHYSEASGKNISPRMLNFSQIHHQTHSWAERNNQGSGIYREAAIMSERPLKLSNTDCNLAPVILFSGRDKKNRSTLGWGGIGEAATLGSPASSKAKGR